MGRRILAAALVAFAAVPPAAQADSIVFRRGTDIWAMAPDGTGQRQITRGDRSYEWPSAADDGTIAASDITGSLHRLTPAGVPLGSPIPTAATVATDDTPAEAPTHVRISPDGTRIAYDQAIGGDVTTLWTPAGSTTLAFPNQTHGQEGLVAPSWIGSDRLLLSRDVSALVEGPPEFSQYRVGDGDNSAEPLFTDIDAAWATGFAATASRSGQRFAVLADDAAEAGGTPRRLALRLFAGREFRCEIGLPPEDTFSSASATFSPDGARLAWAESDGIHVATLGALEDCGAIREQVVTLPGAWEPYWTPAALSAPGAGAGRVMLSLRVRSRPHRLTVAKRGVLARVTVSAPARVRLTVRAGGRVVAQRTRVFASAGTYRVRLRVRVARRLVVRAAARGASPAAAVVRPRWPGSTDDRWIQG
jgi:hypothetical protein